MAEEVKSDKKPEETTPETKSEEKKQKKSEKKSKVVWVATRNSFTIMFGLFTILALFYLMSNNPSEITIFIMSLVSIAWIMMTFITFISAIIHLNKYGEKLFAVQALIISGIFLIVIITVIIKTILTL